MNEKKEQKKQVIAPKGDIFQRIAVTLSWTLWERGASVNWRKGKECPVAIEELFEPMGFPLTNARATTSTQKIHEKGLPARRILEAVPLEPILKKIRLTCGRLPAEFTAIRVNKSTQKYRDFLKFNPGKFFLSTESAEIQHSFTGAYGDRCVVFEPLNGEEGYRRVIRQLIDLHVCRRAEKYLGEKGSLFDLLSLQPKVKKEKQ